MVYVVGILILALFITIFLGFPICWSLGIVGLIGILSLDNAPITLIAQSLYGGINYFPFLAIPFFIFAGEVMNKGGITKKLVSLSKLMIGRVPGSLAHVNILTSMFFGGITGSAQADTSCVGGLLIPAMVEDGYSPEEAVAVTAASSCIGPIIPPSILMVVYGASMSVSIAALFMGGLVPGILVGFSLMVVVAVKNKKYHFPINDRQYSSQEKMQIIREAVIPLGLPVIIMGGIMSGVFTATEAGAVSALYALVVGVLILKTVKLKDIYPMLLKTASMTGSILLIIGCSKVVSWLFVLLKLSAALTDFFTNTITNPILFLLLVNGMLLFAGTFMEGTASLIMMAPILLPIATAYGISPVHFGIIMCMNLTIGCATPPLGLCLFLGCKIGRISLGRGARAILGYVLAEILILLLLTYVPVICLGLPSAMGLIG